MNNQKDKKKVVFICGPMTGYENYNRDAFMRKEMELISCGATVLNPAMLPDGLEHEQYLTITRGMIRVSDVICLLPGWEKSEGASQEVVYAMRRNIWPMGFDGAMREKLKEVLWIAFTAGGYAWRSALSNPMRPAEKGVDEFRVPHGFRCRTVPVKDAEPQRATEYVLLPRKGLLDVAEKLTWISGVLEGVQARFAPLPLKLDELGEAKAATDEAYNALCQVLADEVME
ncbi:DUF4406 domain-containing protein [Salmonella enterica subsp. enterica serovar Infantis]|nr:hypothetical protein [Salmonella enterica subsp. enterica serovar Javiana]EHC4523577.1 DUF4406 domain-containing protein [Salmonella enterica subsp. enterica serovar Infantis]EHC5870328.1 DUF4406 domain-containing protein [Salmonella enterica subsp. enterica serovar Eastbourne]EMB5319113.1 DUF4406 domain-containing protein [Salmonella enterica]EHC5910369.1 DUF4406 domain-containing protein [Salmonella enterica subsp. enterica serovar Eastbourne]